VGIPGAAIFASLKYIGVKQSVLYAGVIFLIELIIAQNTMTMVIVRGLFLVASIWAAMYIYKTMFIPRAAKLRELKAFGLGVILMATNIVAVILSSIVHQIVSGSFAGEFTTNILGYIKAGLLVGAGLGLGFELGDRLIKKSRH
jgi:membrane protease YdiL (CAAX protease family)